jgi:hypothetical protein
MSLLLLLRSLNTPTITGIGPGPQGSARGNVPPPQGNAAAPRPQGR